MTLQPQDRRAAASSSRSRPLERRGAWTGYALAHLALAACGDGASEPSRTPITAAGMAQYVTGEAAASLDPSGYFRFDAPADDPMQISRERAEAIAALWPRQFGPWIKSVLEKEHGGRIDLGAVRVCGTIRYAASPFEPLAPALAAKIETEDARRAYGPWWLVTLCSGNGTPQISLAVSAFSTGLRMTGGEIILPRTGGEWFSWSGIPRAFGREHLELPERAVQRIVERTGRRVSAPPILFIPPRSEGWPEDARARLILEGEARARRRDGTEVTTREFYAGRRPGPSGEGFEIPAATQPDQITFRYPTTYDVPADEPLTFTEGTLRRRGDAALSFEAVTVQGGK